MLSQGKGKKRSFATLNEVHIRIFPHYKNDPQQFAHLWDVINYLVANEQLVLPAEKGKGWRIGNPRLPNWVSINVVKKVKVSIIPRAYAWHPKLAPFVDELTTRQKETAFKISEYLKQHVHKGAFELSIPRRERSLKIFGDEKQLDSLSNKGLILSGHLSLADLGCHDIGWPMPCCLPLVPCPNRPFLIVENHHTYDSFSKWNAETLHYAGIGYGAGEAFSTVETDHIDVIIKPTGASEIHYFGDIDPKGISIPTRVSKARVAKNRKAIVPAIELYQWLLENGIERTFLKKQQPIFAKGWLPVSVENSMIQLFAEKKWFPQEALGYEELKSGVIDV